MQSTLLQEQNFVLNLRWFIFCDSEIVANKAEIGYKLKKPDIWYLHMKKVLIKNLEDNAIRPHECVGDWTNERVQMPLVLQRLCNHAFHGMNALASMRGYKYLPLVYFAFQYTSLWIRYWCSSINGLMYQKHFKKWYIMGAIFDSYDI